MLPRIKPDSLKNDFYIVKPMNNTVGTISFVDFVYSTSTVQPNIFNKNIQLHKLEISISKYLNISEMQYVNYIYSIIKKEIDNEYFKKITELGEKNRFNAPVNRLDIDISKMRTEYNGDFGTVSRRITSNCITSSNFIAVNGRCGNAHWITSNIKTYNYLINYLDSSYNNDNKINIGNIQYIINDSVDDDILLLGRKNTIDQSGAHCFILTDDDGYILFNEYINAGDHFNKNYVIYYAIEDIGISPELQYLKLNTRSLSYYRRKKLEKIRKLNGE